MDVALKGLVKELEASLADGEDRSLPNAVTILGMMKELPLTHKDLENHIDIIKRMKKLKKAKGIDSDDAKVIGEFKDAAGELYSGWKAEFTKGASS